MADIFLSQDWMDRLSDKLNNDARYAQIASKWEGDLKFEILPGGDLAQPVYLYLDLWHGACRQAKMLPGLQGVSSAFTLTATYDDITKLLTGKLDPMQALMTRKLRVQGSMAYMMRNVPILLDFVRCAREVTGNTLS
jgi:putative sterol carrier protein